MPERTASHPPLPLVQAFLLCREVLYDARTKEFVIIGPTSQVPLTQFPANVRLSAFLQIIDGHGRYQLGMSLRDSHEEKVWSWQVQEPLKHPHPLLPHQVTFHDLVLTVPALGRYQLVLLANSEELAQQSLWMGESEAFR